MRISKAAVAVGLAFASLASLSTVAAQPGSQIITLTTAAGSGHSYDGVLDVCNGKFKATGTTQGSTALYQEVVTGTITDTVLNYTSTYYGEVNDGTGIYDPYTYTVDAVRTDGTWSGTYMVTKTSVEPPYQTTTETGTISGDVTYGGTLLAGQFKNHGQCIRSFAAAR